MMIDKKCAFQKTENEGVATGIFTSKTVPDYYSCVIGNRIDYANYHHPCNTDNCPLYRIWQILEANKK